MTATKTQLKPLADRVVLQVLEESEQTSGGIYLPETAREKPMRGKVVAIGDGKMMDNGQREPMTVKVGDVVLFAKYGGTEVKLDGEEFKILSEKDILAIMH